jgi:hypothetical protein
MTTSTTLASSLISYLPVAAPVTTTTTSTTTSSTAAVAQRTLDLTNLRSRLSQIMSTIEPASGLFGLQGKDGKLGRDELKAVNAQIKAGLINPSVILTSQQRSDMQAITQIFDATIAGEQPTVSNRKVDVNGDDLYSIDELLNGYDLNGLLGAATTPASTTTTPATPVTTTVAPQNSMQTRKLERNITRLTEQVANLTSTIEVQKVELTGLKSTADMLNTLATTYKTKADGASAEQKPLMNLIATLMGRRAKQAQIDVVKTQAMIDTATIRLNRASTDLANAKTSLLSSTVATPLTPAPTSTPATATTTTTTPTTPIVTTSITPTPTTTVTSTTPATTTTVIPAISTTGTTTTPSISTTTTAGTTAIGGSATNSNTITTGSTTVTTGNVLVNVKFA